MEKKLIKSEKNNNNKLLISQEGVETTY